MMIGRYAFDEFSVPFAPGYRVGVKLIQPLNQMLGQSPPSGACLPADRDEWGRWPRSAFVGQKWNHALQNQCMHRTKPVIEVFCDNAVHGPYPAFRAQLANSSTAGSTIALKSA